MNRKTPSGRWRNLLAPAAVALLAATALVGFAHTKPGRPLLAWMGRAMGKGSASCPLGFDRAATPEQREQARMRFAATHRGTEPAAARPAAGFILDRTTRAEVLAWSSANDLSCAPGRGLADVSCPAVPDSLLPAPLRGAGTQTVWFVFGEGNRLVSVTLVASTQRPERLSAMFEAVVDDLTREAGPPIARDGDFSPASLSSGALVQARAEYRFRDYYAMARATNVGSSGYALTEEFRSLPN